MRPALTTLNPIVIRTLCFCFVLFFSCYPSLLFFVGEIIFLPSTADNLVVKHVNLGAFATICPAIGFVSFLLHTAKANWKCNYLCFLCGPFILTGIWWGFWSMGSRKVQTVELLARYSYQIVFLPWYVLQVWGMAYDIATNCRSQSLVFLE